MKYISNALMIMLLLTLFSCDDFLDMKPKDTISPGDFFYTEADLASYATKCYEVFPYHSGTGFGLYKQDENSDDQTASNYHPDFVVGFKMVQKDELNISLAKRKWGFSQIRNTNFFLDNVIPLYEESKIKGSMSKIEHYIGEVYFFRAYSYFEKLKLFGDFPIITKVLNDNYFELAEASKRRPRNEVARFILSDLDKAIELLSETPFESNRLSKDVALQFKSRVALYEGSWLKYHKGTSFVPKGPGWPGENMSYLSEFTIDIDDEINFFLTEAINSSKIVADKYYDKLTPSDKFGEMFASNDLSQSFFQEVLLWKRYDASLNITHSLSYSIQNSTSGGTGMTRSLIESYLMKNGLPIYVTNSGFSEDLIELKKNRDTRLDHTTSIEGDVNYMNDAGNTVYMAMAKLIGGDGSKCSTGYPIRKGLNTKNRDLQNRVITGCIQFRAAESLLNYLEAYYILNGSLDNDCDKFWGALRNRAGMPANSYLKTIEYTNLNKERDLATHSAGILIDPILYNIRRERRCEFATEGFRRDDLNRWRALDLMNNYHIEGINLWGNHGLNSGYYSDRLIAEGNADGDTPNVSSPKNSDYLRPLQIMAYSNPAFNGYNFKKAHYLEPIANLNFHLATPVQGGPLSTTFLYQNPGWKIETGSTAQF